MVKIRRLSETLYKKKILLVLTHFNRDHKLKRG